MPAFTSSQNKDVVRQHWDLPLIKQWHYRVGDGLSYFGLPGREIKDLIEWKPFLKSSTGVERARKGRKQKDEDASVRRQILRNARLNGIDQLQILRGDIEDIILDGISIDGSMPSHATTDGNPLLANFHYSLVNLDFLGGFAFPNNKGESKRISALRKLFERQQRTDFLFLLSVNVRDTLEEEISAYLRGFTREAVSRSEDSYSSTLAWYSGLGEGMKKYRLKALVPIFVRRESERWGFDCYCFPPLSYIGTGNNTMVHFVFELIHQTSILHAFSEQSEPDVIDLPLIEVSDGQIIVPKGQHPNFDFSRCEQVLSNLPDGIREQLSIQKQDDS